MNQLPPFDLAGFSAYRLTVAAQKLSDAFARQYRDQFGISNPEWRVLVHISQSDGTSIRDIEARVAMEKSKGGNWFILPHCKVDLRKSLNTLF